MKLRNLSVSALAIFVTLACTIQLFNAPAPSPQPVLLTRVVIVPTDTIPAQPTDIPAQPTYTPLPTFTPYPTIPPPTASNIPPTSPPQFAVSATLIKNANCRAGPSQAYLVVTSFFSGQVLEIVGRNPDFNNTWWQVVIPGTYSTCWISLTTAQASGNFDDLPIVYPPY